jgi:putative pyruvate formate lyase activating enzyme
VKPGKCRAPAVPRIALASLHFWEEPLISGTRGSGAIFFSHCNLACVFCQNWDISQGAGEGGTRGESKQGIADYRLQNADCRIGVWDGEGLVRGREVSIERLREVAFELKSQGAHNINLVSPTPYSDMILEALLPVKEELGIPVVWNSNGYERVEVVRRLEPLVDVYLPDLKFCDSLVSERYCGAPDYFEFASKAIGEMWRQKKGARVGISDSGMRNPEPSADRMVEGAGIPELMTRGVIIRHLVIPGQAEDSKKVLKWIAGNLGTEVYVSLMAQYTPAHRAVNYPEVNRRLRHSEYDEVREYFEELEFEKGWAQELTAASSEYTPEFDLRGI